MNIGVAETARHLGTNRDQVKHWAHHFREHLSSSANPSRGTPRQLSPDDLVILAYVAVHWESDSDNEGISSALRLGEHRQPRYMDWKTAVTPLFQDPPLEIDDTWRDGALVGGLAAVRWDKFALGDSFKLAGDVLVDGALSAHDPDELIYPILYNYRHAIELYLKATLSSASTEHSLSPLLDALRVRLQELRAPEIPSWFEGLVLELNDFDASSTTFRYGETGVVSRRTGDSGEFWIDLQHLRKLVDWFTDACWRIRQLR